MKQARKRDPSKEPYASRLSHGERLEMIRRVQAGEHEDNDVEAYVYDQQRAQDKLSAAAAQLAGERRFELFSQPEISAASARATTGVYRDVNLIMLKAGASAKRAHRKAGLGRHSEFHDPETTKRYAARRNAWQALNREADAEGKPRPEGRPLAAGIARITKHPYNTVRTWIKEEMKRRESEKRPVIAAGDWGQLMDWQLRIIHLDALTLAAPAIESPRLPRIANRRNHGDKLQRPSDYVPEEDARFEIHFEKYRNSAGEDAKPIEARLEADHAGRTL